MGKGWLLILGLGFALSAGAIEGAMSARQRVEKELVAVRVAEPSESRNAEEARLLYWLARYTEAADTKREILEKGLALAEGVKGAEWKNPVALIAWIALKGEQVQMKNKLVALSYLKPLEKAAKDLKTLDPTFFNYASDRILGRLYHLAPPFISIGSNRKAREHLESAMKGAPLYPENQLMYAEFLWAEGEKEKAVSLVRSALHSPLLANFPIERTAWKQMGTQWLREWGQPL